MIHLSGLMIEILCAYAAISDFFKITLADILKLLVPIIVAYVVVEAINKKIFHYKKTQEIREEVLQKISSQVDEIHKRYDVNHRSRKDVHIHLVQITNIFTNAFGITEKIKEGIKLEDGDFSEAIADLYEYLKKLHALVTDDNMSRLRNKFSDDEKREIDRIYYSIKRRVLEGKFKLYS